MLKLNQIASNDKFKSVDHRVIASHVGPRVSVACFFTGHNAVISKSYGPIKELTSEENPPIYRDFLVSEYFGKRFSKVLDENSLLDQFKL